MTHPSASGSTPQLPDEVPTTDARSRRGASVRDRATRQRTLFDAMDQGFCIIEPVDPAPGRPLDFRYVVVNPAFERHTGLHDVVGRTIRELVPSAEAHILDRYGEVARTGQPQRFEAYVAALDLWMDAEVFLANAPGQIAVLFSNISDRKRVELALADELLAMRRLHELTARLVSASALPEALSEILDAAMTLHGADSGNVHLYDPTTRTLRLVAQRGFAAPVLEYFAEVRAGDASACAMALACGERVEIEDVEQDPAYAPKLEAARQAGYRAVQSTPLYTRAGEPIGMLSTFFRMPHRLTEGERRFTDIYARLAADAIARYEAEAALRASEARQAFLVRLGDALRLLADPLEIQAVATRILGEHLGADRVVYIEIDGDEYVIERDYVNGIPSMAGRYPVASFGPGKLAEYRAGTTRVVHDTEADPHNAPSHNASFAAVSVRAGIGVPLVKEGVFVANLAAHMSRPREWTPEEVALVEETAERTWAAVERARAEVTLRANELAIRKSEERLRLALRASGMGTFIWYPAEDRSDPDAQALVLFGLPADGAPQLASALPQIFHPDDAPGYAAAVARAMDPRSDGTLYHEFRIRRPVDGVERWMAVTADTQFAGEPGDPGRHAVRMTGVLDDITERKAAEAALRASEERQAFLVRLGDALRPLGDPAAVLDVATRMLGEHLRADRAYYVEVDEPRNAAVVERDYVAEGHLSLVGEHPVSSFAWVMPIYRAGCTNVVADARTDEQIPDADRAALLAVQITACIGAPVVKDGAVVGSLCVTTAEPRSWTHEEIALVESTAEQIWASIQRARVEAALRESEARYRTLVENVRDYAIFLLDADGVITEWTAGAECVKGYTAPEVLGRHLAMFYPPEELAAGQPAAELAEAAAAGRAEREGWRVRKGGERIWVNEIATAIHDVNGRLAGFTKISRDLTERRRAEEALAASMRAQRDALEASEAARADAEAARREADAANHAKSEFLAVMSHELRTPLNAIGGYTELIELGIRGPVTEAQRADLARIQKSQRHLLGLINGVLNYAKVDAGAVHYEVTDVPVDDVLATCEALVAPEASAKQIALTLAGCDSAVCARADREKVQQIVLNLLSNAIKFTDAGGRVSMTCGRLHEAAGDGPRVVVQVTDRGRGIAPDHLERVFQPFVQVDARLTRTQDGTGLGLAISRDLARGMGGELSVDSRPGEGSTFTLTLPAA